jgi:conjugal transfer pilus assembly protein TraA
MLLFAWWGAGDSRSAVSYRQASGEGKNIQRTKDTLLSINHPEFSFMTINTLTRQAPRKRDYLVPAIIALAGASAAFAGADTTFDPALTMFTDFLEGSGGKIITVLSLAGGLIALASGRFALGQVAVPGGVGIGVGTGVPIVTSVVTATI